MSALNFDKWWDGEGKESNKWLSEKGVAKKAWNAAIKAKEAGEQRLTKQNVPLNCDWCGKSGGKLKRLHDECYEGIMNGAGII